MKDKCLACCNIYEDKEHVVLKLEMTGVSKENLDIKIDGDSLIVSATRDVIELKGEYRIREIDSRDFYHKFTIDDTIDREKVSATVNNGIVTITLGIKESVKPRKIEIL